MRRLIVLVLFALTVALPSVQVMAQLPTPTPTPTKPMPTPTPTKPTPAPTPTPVPFLGGTPASAALPLVVYWKILLARHCRRRRSDSYGKGPREAFSGAS